MRQRGMTLTRRDFAIRLASLIAAGAANPALGQDELRSFRVLSARLTGFSEAEIDPELALGMVDGVRAAGLGSALESLLGNEPSGEDELARQIAVAWYSGMHPDGAGTSLRAYYDALVWRALEFTKPPGQCSATPGDWSEPPAGTSQ